MQRYFAEVIDGFAYLSNDDAHHLFIVMRAKINQKIEVVCDSKLYLCEILSANPIKIKVIKDIENNSELPVDVTLFYCLSKGSKIDFVVQKATELGASKIILLNSKRSVVKYDDNVANKLNRFTKIAKEACEQCKRVNVPTVLGPIDILKLESSDLSEVNFVAYEEVSNTGEMINFDKNIHSVSVLIGSEGGFDNEEIKYLNSLGFKSISLGKRILRTETAAINALSIISYIIEK